MALHCSPTQHTMLTLATVLVLLSLPSSLDALSLTNLYSEYFASSQGKTADISNNVADDSHLNMRPIIGILSQEPSESLIGYNATSCVVASYVKAVESAGGRVVPVLIDQPYKYYKKLATSLNGFLFPGGGADITNSSGYGRTGEFLYRLALEVNANKNNNNALPLWTTCLGYHMLTYLASGHTDLMTHCEAEDSADPLQLQGDWQSSQLWKNAPADLMDAVQKENITANFHRKCLMPEAFNKHMGDRFTLLSTTVDANGLEYVSTIEHKKYPIFGTQWHPEKASFEWIKESIPHTVNAVRLEQYVMEVFMEIARHNHNTFDSKEEEDQHLIYRYTPVYTGDDDPYYTQTYFFN